MAVFTSARVPAKETKRSDIPFPVLNKSPYKRSAAYESFQVLKVVNKARNGFHILNVRTR